MTLLAILVVLNAQFLWKKNVNLKLETVKNYNTKPKKKKTSFHAQSTCDKTSILKGSLLLIKHILYNFFFV